MTNTGGTPAGWYHAPGDPEGTQRYWDGAQWIGDAQAAPQQPAQQAPQTPDATVAYTPPAASDPGAGQPPQYGAVPGAGQQPPAYGSPPPGAGAPGGSAAFGGGSVASVGTPAEFGSRVIAYLIDVGIVIGIFFIGFILTLVAGAIADGLGFLMLLVTYAAMFAFWIWNTVLVQGKTGQSFGKQKQNIKLVSDDTGEPVGAGMAFVRYLVAAIISSITCGIAGLLDYLWPLWDEEKKRLTDKILNMSVVNV